MPTVGPSAVAPSSPSAACQKEAMPVAVETGVASVGSDAALGAAEVELAAALARLALSQAAAAASEAWCRGESPPSAEPSETGAATFGGVFGCADPGLGFACGTGTSDDDMSRSKRKTKVASLRVLFMALCSVCRIVGL